MEEKLGIRKVSGNFGEGGHRGLVRGEPGALEGAGDATWPPQETAARKANVVARPAATDRQADALWLAGTRRSGGNKLTSMEANTAGISSLKAWREIQG